MQQPTAPCRSDQGALDAGPTPGVAATVGSTASANGGPPRILVVDDEPPIVELVAGYLAREGWEVRTAADGPAALDGIRTWMPDAVVLDLMLPGLDGIEVCWQMRGF